MADFNQSPLGQVSIAIGGDSASLVIGSTTLNVQGGTDSFGFTGTSATFDLASTVVSATGMFPSWRRPTRVISG